MKSALTLVQSADPSVSLYVAGPRRIYIPDADTVLIARIVAIAHQGKHSHAPFKTTLERCEEVFVWDDMKKNIKQLVANCLQCIKLAGGNLMPRPLGHQLLATIPMEVIAADFMKVGEGEGGYKYLLVIIDQLTRITVCVPTKNQTAATAARILCERWLAFFPDPVFLITDGGPAFKATLFGEVARIRGFNHHIIAPHAQWANGGCERLNRVWLKNTRAMLNSVNADWRDWPGHAPAVNECINKRMQVSNRDNKTPMELLMGIKAKNPLKHLVWTGIDAAEYNTIDPAAVDDAFDNIHQHLPNLWAKAYQSQQDRRLRNIRPGRQVPFINIGDLVLVAEAVPAHKLQMRWTGPHEVTGAINQYVFEVRPIVPPPHRRKTIKAHIVRIRRFSNAALGTAADRERIEQSAINDYPANFVHRIIAHRANPTNGRLQLRVRWLGFDSAGDTWQQAARLASEVPDRVEDYLRSNPSGITNRFLRRHFP